MGRDQGSGAECLNFKTLPVEARNFKFGTPRGLVHQNGDGQC